MAIDQRRRQKKLEKRNARQKAAKKALAQRKPDDVSHRFLHAGDAPILHCCWHHESGIGRVVVSRLFANGHVAFVVFLVDLYCLGVKDVHMGYSQRGAYENSIYDPMRRDFSIEALAPQCARKLIEEVVAFAHAYGFEPHPDYRTARLIFGDIHAAECECTYEFGMKGEPLYIPGPYDSPARVARIMSTLNNNTRRDKANFLIPAPRSFRLPNGSIAELIEEEVE
jgi:hypothetical protein